MQVGKTLILDPIRITRDADCLSESIEVAKVPEMHLPQTPKRIKVYVYKTLQMEYVI